MKVSIYSKPELFKIIRDKGLPPNTAVISFTDEGFGEFLEFPITADVLKIEFDDIRARDIPKERIVELLPEAHAIAVFVDQKIKEHKDIICQCDYGISRSAGLAAAILERYAHRGIDVFSNYKYNPNQIVFNKVFEELKKL